MCIQNNNWSLRVFNVPNIQRVLLADQVVVKVLFAGVARRKMVRLVGRPNDFSNASLERKEKINPIKLMPRERSHIA